MPSRYGLRPPPRPRSSTCRTPISPTRSAAPKSDVAGLAEALRPYGVHSAVAAPGDVDDSYLHDDLPIFRFATERGADLDRAYGAPDPRAAQSFMALIARLRPRIVHLHASTAAVSVRLVDAAHAAGGRSC